MKQLFSIILLTLTISSSPLAGTYKWVDEDGNVQYSQHPPASGKYESIRVRPAPRQSADQNNARPSSKEYLDKAASQRKDESRIKQELKKTQDLRKKNCETAKKQLEFYTVYRRKKDKTGEYVRIDDNEKAAGLKEAKQGIKDFCD